MPTVKTRINLSVPDDINTALKMLAHRAHVPVATQTLDLLRRALEADEDNVLLEIAESRERRKGRMISHASAWR